jgi:hypothetical protein
VYTNANVPKQVSGGKIEGQAGSMVTSVGGRHSQRIGTSAIFLDPLTHRLDALAH